MEKPVFRKPRMYFDTTARPPHVNFDDGKTRRILPWGHFVEACWDYAEPDTIRITIGNWLVVLSGYNLEPVFAAIADRSLSQVAVHPDFEEIPEHCDDTFATGIRFLHAPEAKPKKGQSEFELGLE